MEYRFIALIIILAAFYGGLWYLGRKERQEEMAIRVMLASFEEQDESN